MENNKLIADFMGIPFDGKYYLAVTTHLKLDERNYSRTAQDLKFRSRWDWIMPVVDRIESIIVGENNSFNVTIGSTNYCVIQDSNGELFETVEDGGETKLETTYKAVVEFIKWYNKN